MNSTVRCRSHILDKSGGKMYPNPSACRTSLEVNVRSIAPCWDEVHPTFDTFSYTLSICRTSSRSVSTRLRQFTTCAFKARKEGREHGAHQEERAPGGPKALECK